MMPPSTPQPGPNTPPPAAPQPTAPPQQAAPPPPPPRTDPTIKRDMSKGELDDWWEAIRKSRQNRKRLAVWWDANMKHYAPAPNDDPLKYGANINTNRDFTLVERKKADLFYQKPDVTAVASPLMAGHEDLLETHTNILNEKLGPDGVDAEALVDQVLFDLLCPSGMGWSEMGYESATIPTPMDVPDGETPQPGSVLGLAPGSQKTKTAMAPVPIFEDCFWSHFSPWQALKPANARTTESDLWPWIGRDLEIPLRVAKRKGWVPANEKGTTADAEGHFQNGVNDTEGGEIVRGVLIYCLSSLYRDDRPHPLHQTRIVLIDGQNEPAEYHDSPYQTLDAQWRLTPDSLVGYPIHPCTIRTMTDSSDIASDCTISRPLVNELNKFREQMVEQRDANTLRWMYNVDTLPPDALNKIIRSPLGGFIGVPAEAFVGEGAIKELPHGTYPRENFQFNDYLDNDLARTHAIDAEQSGASQPGDQTATESQIKQNNVNARLGRERGRVLSWYVKGVTKYSAIVQRLLPVEDAAAIVGQAAAAQWDTWRKIVPARFAFTALPDSSSRMDNASDRKRVRDDYTFLVNDPFVNPIELRKYAFPRMGYPAKVLNAQPPQPQAQPTKAGFTFKGDDLNPLNPQFSLVIEIARQSGFQISQDAVTASQTAAAHTVASGVGGAGADTGLGATNGNSTHGGKLAPMESLSKHATDLTGGMQGTGSPAPMGAGGTLQ